MTSQQLLGLVLIAVFLALRHRKQPQSEPDHLERRLFDWPDGSPFSVRDLLEGGVAIMGRSGSGKSSGSLYQIMKRLIALGNNGGCIHASGPGDREFWTRVFKESGRLGDLHYFGPSDPGRFNFLDLEMTMSGDTRNMTKALLTIGEVLDNDASKGGGGRDEFWAQQNEEWLFDAIEVIKQARGRVTIDDLMSFFTTAAGSAAMILDPKWREKPHHTMIAEAYDKPKTPMQQRDFDSAMNAWIYRWPVMNDRTRSSIEAGIMGILHVLSTGWCRELLSTTTNISPSIFEDRQWLLVDWPVSKGGSPAAMTNCVWKLYTQKFVLARNPRPGDPLIASVVDEYQRLINSPDSSFLNESRKFYGTTIAATQSIHSYLGAMKGAGGHHQVEALLSAMGTKIFHQLGDAKSAEYASSLLGSRRELFVSLSPNREGGPFSPDFSPSTNESYQPTLQPSVFMDGSLLPNGGPGNGYRVGGIVIRSTPFLNGERFQVVSFSQR